MNDHRRAQRLFVVLALAALFAGCAISATTTPAPPPSTSPWPSWMEGNPATPTPSVPPFVAPRIVHGAPLDPGPKPEAAVCEQMIRDEHLAAARIRAGLSIQALHSDVVVAFEVSKDPDSTISPTEGIPLTDEEMALIEASHVSGWETPLSLWVEYGAPERFGGFWIEPPGTRSFVVAIPPADTATRALARCLEPADGEIRYVQAAVTKAALDAIRGWIREDADWLRASGIELTSIGSSVVEGTVSVGVHGLTPEIAEFLVERYGWPVRVHEKEPTAIW